LVLVGRRVACSGCHTGYDNMLEQTRNMARLYTLLVLPIWWRKGNQRR
jgi:hypothetical protein